MAFFGKLHSVAKEIGEHLAHTTRIAHVSTWQKEIEIHQEINPLVAAIHLHQGDQFLGALLEVKLFLHQHQLTGLNLGEIEHVIDDHQEGFARVLDGLCEKLLFFVQFRIEQQF